MDWIENGYHLLWTEVPPASKELPNASPVYEQHELVSSTIVEMLAAHAVTLLPLGEKTTVVSPLGVVPKRETSKFRRTVNVRYIC